MTWTCLSSKERMPRMASLLRDALTVHQHANLYASIYSHRHFPLFSPSFLVIAMSNRYRVRRNRHSRSTSFRKSPSPSTRRSRVNKPLMNHREKCRISFVWVATRSLSCVRPSFFVYNLSNSNLKRMSWVCLSVRRAVGSS